jgi:S1-C subfamily serine protease
MKLPIAIIALGLASACGPKPEPQGPIVVDQEPEPAAPVYQEEPRIERARKGSIARASLVAVLDEGVGRFLQSVDLSAVKEGGRFSGWQIARIDNPWVDLQRGDIILTVNGQVVETPAQAQALWASLRHSDAIVVEAVREGAPFQLRFEVVGDPPADVP